MTTSNLPPLLGLYSPAPQSGKSTFADFLVNREWERLSFATPLKRMAVELFRSAGFSDDEVRAMLHGNLKEVPVPALGNQTPRYIMQRLGTEFGREMIAPNLWVDIAMKRAQTLREQGFFVVFDDMRFPNEAEAIKAAGGKIIKIDRPCANLTGAHASEGALSDWNFDRILTNDRTLYELEKQAALLDKDLMRAHAA